MVYSLGIKGHGLPPICSQTQNQCWPQSWNRESVLHTGVSSPTCQIRKDSKSKKRSDAGGVQGTEQGKRSNQDSIISGLTGACLCALYRKDARLCAFYEFLFICCLRILVWKLILGTAELPVGVVGGGSPPSRKNQLPNASGV